MFKKYGYSKNTAWESHVYYKDNIKDKLISFTKFLNKQSENYWSIVDNKGCKVFFHEGDLIKKLREVEGVIGSSLKELGYEKCHIITRWTNFEKGSQIQKLYYIDKNETTFTISNNKEQRLTFNTEEELKKYMDDIK